MRTSCLAVLVLAAASLASAQDPLNAARELYASAAYEEALATLGRLQNTGTPSAVLEQADQYRAFCLVALGRTGDAQSVIENLIRRNPAIQLDATDASPRIAAMFEDVRRRLLPELVRAQYREARAAIDRKDYVAAEPQLARVQRMIEEAEKLDVEDESLGDLRVLVEGFLDLARSVRVNAENAQRAAAEAPRQAAAPPVTSQSAPPSAVENPKTPPMVLVDQSSPDITPPVAIVQEMPPVPAAVLLLLKSGKTSGVLDVLVDELGNVERSVIRQSINAAYDEIVLRASRQWKYRPARRGDLPIKYLKTIAVVVQK
jgi:tetratricopeptide (TPR) repeat protein